MQFQRRRRPARAFRPGQELAGFDRLETKRLLDGTGGTYDMQLDDIFTFESDNPTTLADEETAEAHVDEAMTVAPSDIGMVAQGQRAPTMEDILKQIDIGKKVALGVVDLAISINQVVLDKGYRYYNDLGQKLAATSDELDNGNPTADRRQFLEKKKADLQKLRTEMYGYLDGLEEAKKRLQAVRTSTAITWDIMKERIRALYSQPAEGQAATIQEYATDDIAIVV